MTMPTVCFVAANQGVSWGASEFLWSGAALSLAGREHVQVVVCVKAWSVDLDPVRRLASRGCTVIPRPVLDDELAFAVCEVPQEVGDDVLRARPDLVVVSHGDNREGLPWMEFCAAHDLRYVSLAHRATEWDWPPDVLVDRLRAAYLSARAAHFVSQHNLHLTEQMICARLSMAAVVRNPYTVSYADVLPWPAPNGVFRMACVARLDLESKAHDALFAVLAMPKWRCRALHLDVVGREGPDVRLVRGLSDFRGLEHVTFRNSVDEIRSVWVDNHALVLPSRTEGLPVAIVEAMLSGRPCLVTDVGGAAEVIEHGRTGWVAAAPTVRSLDRALEQAWESRARWAAMGSAAARSIRSLVPADPAGSYAELLLALT